MKKINSIQFNSIQFNSILFTIIFCFWGNVSKGQLALQDSIKQLQHDLTTSKNKKDSVKTLLNISEVLRIVNPSSDSIEYLIDKAYSLANELKNDSLLGSVFQEKALYYAFLEDSEEAILNFQNAYKAYTNAKDIKGQVFVLASLAQEYSKISEREITLNYVAQALSLTHQMNEDNSLLSSVFGRIGVAYDRLYTNIKDEKFKDSDVYCDSSIWYFDKALYHTRNQNPIDPSTLSLRLNNMGSALLDCGYSRDTAMYYFRETLSVAEAYNIRDTRLMALINLGHSHRKLGRLDSAFIYLNRAKVVSDSLKDIYLEQQLHRNWVFYWIAKNDYKKAFESIENFYDIRLELLGEEKSKALAEQEVKFQTQQKEQQIALQKSELTAQTAQIQSQRYLIAGVSGGLALSAALAFVFFRLNGKNKRLSQRNATLVREVNHRVKNNLQVLSSLLGLQSRRLADPIAKTAIEESQLRVSSMSFIHRRLYGEQLREISAAEYLEELVQYVTSSYGLRPPQFTLSFNITPAQLDVEKMIPVGLIVNELVSNACKYAFADHPNPKLAVDFEEEDGKWLLRVADNGQGLPEEQLTQQGSSKSFGMKLIQLQATQLEGSVVFENADGLVASLRFPKSSLRA